jgi:hypothetical protein
MSPFTDLTKFKDLHFAEPVTAHRHVLHYQTATQDGVQNGPQQKHVL